MSESTREWILKRRHEDPGEQGTHPCLSFNFTLADDLRSRRLCPSFWLNGAAGPNCAAMPAHRRLVALRGLNHIEVEPNSATVEWWLGVRTKLSAKLLVSPESG